MNEFTNDENNQIISCDKIAIFNVSVNVIILIGDNN